jgi:hypothetical protein
MVLVCILEYTNNSLKQCLYVEYYTMDVPVSIPSSASPDNTQINSSPAPNQSASQKTRLVDMSVKNQNDALNILIAFLTMAQKRGAFALEESAKLWECVKMFSNPEAPQSQGVQPPVPPSQDGA